MNNVNNPYNPLLIKSLDHNFIMFFYDFFLTSNILCGKDSTICKCFSKQYQQYQQHQQPKKRTPKK